LTFGAAGFDEDFTALRLVAFFMLAPKPGSWQRYTTIAGALSLLILASRSQKWIPTQRNSPAPPGTLMGFGLCALRTATFARDQN
jgi:hypothetical protein